MSARPDLSTQNVNELIKKSKFIAEGIEKKRK